MEQPRLLVVNCASPYFFSIPMGTFGLCDFLARRGMACRIFNPALYALLEAEERLDGVLEAFRPTHVGLVLHWQETAHGFLEALARIRAWNPEVITLAGGFTAAYFAEDLLACNDGLGYVVLGDPEEPVAQLLSGRPPATIANLVWRENGRIRRSGDQWLIDAAQLDCQSFADLSPLIDSERYLDKVEGKLGFPLFLGRGCVFDCGYCGGSRHAFRLHSGRRTPAVRSIGAVLADLRRLRGRVRTLYLCYENDPDLIKELFRAIAADPELRGRFTLNYGAWHLLDSEFLRLYREAFDCAATPPLFEFSPEVASDFHRQAIKRGVTYTLAELEENIGAIDQAFHGRVRIEVFFSRYHPQLSAAEMEDEIGRILLCKHRLLCADRPAHVCFDHLSTDVGSRIWQEHIPEPGNFAAFLHAKNEIDSGRRYPFPVDNLCLLVPAHLRTAEQLQIEALCLTLEQLERYCPELVHCLAATCGAQWLAPLAQVLGECLAGAEAAAFFEQPPLTAVVGELGQRLVAGGLACPPFLADLLRFSLKKLERLDWPPPAPFSPEKAGEPLLLDSSRVTVHEQDYLDLLPLLRRLGERKGDGLPYRRTVCLYLHSAILSLPHAVYRATLKAFERPLSLADYGAALGRRPEIEGPSHHRLLTRLLDDGLLRPASP